MEQQLLDRFDDYLRRRGYSNRSEAVRDLIRNSDSFMPSPEVIIEETGKCYGIEVSDIMSTSRTKEVTMARQVSMYIIRNLTKLSLPEIGRVFGPDLGLVSDAKAALERIAMGRNAECIANHKSYDRVVATCRIGGRSIGDMLRAAGIVEGGNGYK